MQSFVQTFFFFKLRKITFLRVPEHENQMSRTMFTFTPLLFFTDLDEQDRSKKYSRGHKIAHDGKFSVPDS